MSVPTFFDRVLFNDGEGIDHADFNTLQQMIRAQVADTVWSMRAKSAELLYVPNLNSQVWIPTGSHALPHGGASNLQVVNTPGMIAQYTTVSDPDGATPHMLQYWLAANDISVIVNAADATNPRIDLIVVKLIDGNATSSVSKDFQDALTGAVTSTSFNKRTSTSLTVSYVAGTAAASPTAPAIPTGFAAWAYVYVPATYATTFVDDTHISNACYPVGFRSIVIPAYAMAGWSLAGSTITITGTLEAIEGTGAGSIMHSLLDIGPGVRVVGAAAFGSGSWTSAWKRYDYNTAVIPKNAISTWAGFTAISGPTMGGSATYGTPAIWGNGRSSPYSGVITGIRGEAVALAYTTGAAGDKIRAVRVYTCGS